ncbi:hypothetical protein [Stenotrophomonas sp.]|uniref:hypothetical protein n=1 Tax=Stenotrophomonas sp. TaxID=69392 RepID=UPI0028A28102|nr:hypothetical protein [Stenotrophomonas sp.]
MDDDEKRLMPRIPKHMTAAASLALAACATTGGASPPTHKMQESAPMAHARFTYPETPVLTSGELAPAGDPAKAAEMNDRAPAWPLRFDKHNFSARCHDTLSCEVVYDDVRHGSEKPTRSSASYGPDYLKDWNGGHGGIRNFPPPARVVWTSKDGSAHEAEIDIGEIFSDQLVRHYVPREEVADVPNGQISVHPAILLEVNDRTIRVYMKAFIPTKHLQTPGNTLSAVRRDLVLVKTYTY